MCFSARLSLCFIAAHYQGVTMPGSLLPGTEIQDPIDEERGGFPALRY
jgi:hypothetical protein